jgi:glycosyltransferase involved in cell wall biosynthesis
MKVSVHMITYNHARFIARALDSALAQETNFPFEIVVFDDASTDGTSAIVRQYAQRHPDVIRAVVREKNAGVSRNFIEALLACRGEYIAFLEGDDYWDSPKKLQTQADILDAHPETAIVSHPVKIIVGEDETVRRISRVDPRDVLTFEDVVVYEYPLPTCGTLIRNVLRDVPPWFYELHNLDYATQLLVARHGNVRIQHEPMAVYRNHPGGISKTTGLEERTDRFIFLLNSVNAELGFRYDHLFRRRLAAYYRTKTRVEFQKYRFGAAAAAAWHYAWCLLTSSSALAGRRST